MTYRFDLRGTEPGNWIKTQTSPVAPSPAISLQRSTNAPHVVDFLYQPFKRSGPGGAAATAVLLTASTKTASFGALILSRRQGLQSLGQAITLGVTTCLAASIVFFPADRLHERRLSLRESSSCRGAKGDYQAGQSFRSCL